MWDLVLRRAAYSSIFFAIPYTRPLLLHRGPAESYDDLALRQSEAADFVIFVDACLVHRGIGIFVPEEF